ncbi:MAG: hypothetical protein EOO71_19820 [Myxococcaceae bacterium]|nr:MAG: hypothetical protein EOO71_19820 [Myxococcaceae bacterium]
MYTRLELKSRRGWALGVMLGLALALGACGKDEVEEPALQPGAQGEVEFTQAGPVRLKLAVKAGQLYRFVCEVVPIPGVTRWGCVTQLRDATSLEPLGESRTSGITPSRKGQITVFWVASSDETVVMELKSSAPEDTGAFRYQFTDAVDDAGGSTDEAASRSVTEAPFQGFTESSTDVDAWRFSVPADRILKADCRALEEGRDPDLEFIRPDGTSLGTHNLSDYIFWTGIPYLAVKNVGGGDLILLVRPYQKSPWLYSPRYECQVVDAGPDDHGDVAAQATVVTVPTRVDVTFGSRNDVDVLAADLLAGHVYLLKDVTSSGMPIYCGTTVTDAQGVQQGPKLATDGEGARFTAPASGRYFLALERTLGEEARSWVFPNSHRYEITDVAP